MYLSNEIEGVTNARNEAIARSIIKGLSSQNITIRETQDILCRAQDIIYQEKEKVAISALLNNLK